MPYRAYAVSALLLSCNDRGLDLERMIDQHKFEAYERNPYFADGQTLRKPPDGTVVRDTHPQPLEFRTGMQAGTHLASIPLTIDRALLSRGADRFDIFCAVCHGARGDGRSQVAENMKLRPPPSLHEPRLRDYPPGRLYRIIHEGYGLMPSYAQELDVQERWAVVAYVQALQLSQRVRLAELPANLQNEARPWLK